MVKDKAPAFICNCATAVDIIQAADFWADMHAGDWLDLLRRQNMMTGNPIIDGWTVPLWAQIGDVVFMMETVTSIDTIGRSIKDLKDKAKYLPLAEFKNAMFALSSAKETYDVFGGKIFAIARVASEPEPQFGIKEPHQVANCHSDLDGVCFLKHPIPYDTFKGFQKVSNYGAITSLSKENYNRLKLLVMAENDTPDWFRKGYIA